MRELLEEICIDIVRMLLELCERDQITQWELEKHLEIKINFLEKTR